MFPIVAQAQLTNIQYTTVSDGSGGVVITGFSATGSGPLTIPSTINNLPVTSIGANARGTGAFQNNANVTSVTIPNSVTSIGDYAFFECTSLTSVTMAYGVTSIGNYSFEDSGLASVTIPNSVTSIGGYAFLRCNSLTSLTIPSSVTSIGDYAFGFCNNVASITVSAQNPSYVSVGGVLFNSAQTTLIQFPAAIYGNYTIPDTVTSIGDGAFSRSNLGRVTIPNSVTSIGASAFQGCFGPVPITITIPSSVTSIGVDAFAYSDLAPITVLPGNTAYSSVGGVLFDLNQDMLIAYPDGNTSSSYAIPDTVTSIGQTAFHDPTSLTLLIIPKTITSLVNGEFNGCSSLMSVVFLGNAPSMGGYVFDNGNSGIAPISGFTVYYAAGATGFTSPTWTPDASDSYPAAVDPIIGTTTGTANLLYSSWFGYYLYGSYPLVYEYNLGYEYLFPSGAGVYLYDYSSGHFWYTQSSYFPIVYDFTLNAYLYYYQAYTPHRHFYNFATGKVITE